MKEKINRDVHIVDMLNDVQQTTYIKKGFEK